MHSESALRRRAYREGVQLIKWRENARDYHPYGPYALADLHGNYLVACGMSREVVERQLFG
jgi:hypothetical protein